MSFENIFISFSSIVR